MKKLIIIFIIMCSLVYGKTSKQFFKNKIIPNSVTVDAEGSVYFSDTLTDKVLKYNSKGKYQFSIHFDELKGIVDLFYFDDRIYILSIKGKLYIIDKNGRLIVKKDFEEGNLLDNLNNPNAIYVNEDYIYISDSKTSKIKIYSYNGRPIRDFGYKGLYFNAFSKIGGITRSNKNLFVSDTDTGEVKAFDLNGIYERNLKDEKGNEIRAFLAPEDMFVDKNGDIYIVDAGLSKVVVYNKYMKLKQRFGSKGTRKTEFNVIKDIWVTRDKIYLADSNNKEVKVFNKKTLEYITTLGMNKAMYLIFGIIAFLVPFLVALEVFVLRKKRYREEHGYDKML